MKDKLSLFGGQGAPEAFVKLKLKRDAEYKRMMDELRLKNTQSSRHKAIYENASSLREPLPTSMFMSRRGALTGVALTIARMLADAKLRRNMYDEEEGNKQRLNQYMQEREEEERPERERIKELQERLAREYEEDRQAKGRKNELEEKLLNQRLNKGEIDAQLSQAQIKKLLEESESIKHERNNPTSKPNPESAADARYERGRQKEIHLKQLDAIKNMIPREQYVELLSKAGTPDFELPTDIAYSQPGLFKATLDKLFGKSEKKPKNRTKEPEEDYYINHDTGEKISVAEFKKRQANGTL
jgi:hypothetical protein